MKTRPSSRGFALVPVLIVVAIIVIIAIAIYLLLHRPKGGQAAVPSATTHVAPARQAAPKPRKKSVLKPINEGFSLEGSLASQTIVKKVLPTYPDWAEEQGVMGTVRIRFSVTESGEVASDFHIEQTTGNTPLDDVAVEALRQWRFSPGKTPGAEAPYGVITFVFGLRH
jgi:periplasmic protein TonB